VLTKVVANSMQSNNGHLNCVFCEVCRVFILGPVGECPIQQVMHA